MTTEPVRTASQTHGEVFTRRWVVDLMLDLIGYSDELDLARATVVEPSVGSGAFLGPIVERLAAQAAAKEDPNWTSLTGAVRGFELQEELVHASRELVVTELTAAGCPVEVATTLARAWIIHGDFLLTDHGNLRADFVVGNPPYIRIENLDPLLLQAYRQVAPTMGGRADIFVGFYEHGLDMLKPGGKLAYICADRWMRNSYGKALRGKMVENFSVDDVIVLHDADAFESQVSAYPAITVISSRAQGEAVAATARAAFGSGFVKTYLNWRRGGEAQLNTDEVTAARMPSWHETDEVWPDGSPDVQAWLTHLDATFPPLENPEDETKLGIGIATGADKIYVRRNPHLPEVEDDRLLPMVTADDVRSGRFEWRGSHLVNPWGIDGKPVSLRDFPMLGRYYSAEADALKGRSVAKRSGSWHRTIDNVRWELLDQDLLVMQDMKAHASPVRIPAGYYPHHNLYWIKSNAWDLDALGGLLLSEVVERQVAAYCVKMRGGTLRFQATVLRKVRAPRPSQVSLEVIEALAAAFRARDRKAATDAALRAYGMVNLPI